MKNEIDIENLNVSINKLKLYQNELLDLVTKIEESFGKINTYYKNIKLEEQESIVINNLHMINSFCERDIKTIATTKTNYEELARQVAKKLNN